jgi:hypothetical protein
VIGIELGVMDDSAARVDDRITDDAVTAIAPLLVAGSTALVKVRLDSAIADASRAVEPDVSELVDLQTQCSF